MNFKLAIALSSVFCSIASAVDNDQWTSLKPTASFKSGQTSCDFNFGIDVVPVPSDYKPAPESTVNGDLNSASLTSKTTLPLITQINDGQVQAPTNSLNGSFRSASKKNKATGTKKSQTVLVPSSNPTKVNSVLPSSCRVPGVLDMNLKDSVLRDSRGRIGSIVANQQFQFDGPPPQAGTIYASGWSLTPEGRLAIGSNDVFYRCLSGNFYNLYDSYIAPQCSPVFLNAVKLVDC